MPTLAIILVLIAALSHALRDTMTKKSGDKFLYIWWMTTVSHIFTLPISIYYLMQTEINWLYVFFALLMGLVHSTYWFLYGSAYNKGDISHVYPIIRSTPALILVFEVIFLSAIVSLTGVIGIILVTLGLYVINLKSISLKSLREPIEAIKKEKATQYAFLALLASTTYSLIDKVMVAELNPFVYILFMGASALAFFSIFIRKKLKTQWLKPWRVNKKGILLGSVFAAINYPLVLFAFQLSNASYVTGLRQIGVVFAVIIGALVFKEKSSKIRLLASTFIFAGAFLIVV
jgi:drug/metabolite transporter (DMT)-like permease